MKTKSKTYLAIVSAVFLIGALYGAVMNHAFGEGPTFTRPPTTEEVAAFRASAPRPTPPVNVQDATNTNPTLGL